MPTQAGVTHPSARAPSRGDVPWREELHEGSFVARNGANPAAALVLLCVVISALLLAVASVRAEDWPQWRGPNRDGVWRETGILETIPASGLDVRWRAKVGNGYSGPVVAQGRVFVTDHQFNPEVERIVCFDEATGNPLWVHAYSCKYKDMEYGNGPRAAPTVHDGKVYTLGTQGHLVCLDAAKGGVVWKQNLVEDIRGQIPRYGASAAPIVVGELLIVCAGGQPDSSVVALDRKSGELRWKALPDRPAYSAPILIDAGGARQLVVWTGDSITGFEPATGKVFWQVPWKATFDTAQMVASPVLHKDMLLCLGAWSRGSKMLKLDSAKPGVSVLWETGTKPTTTISTPLFQDDRFFYAILGNGSLACLDAASGQEVWSTREPTSGSFGNAHLTPNGDRVLLFNHTGHLILSRLTPKGYKELGRCLLVEPTAGYRAQGPITWAHPAYANKCVFARNDRELVCASLAASQAAETAAPEPAVNARLLPYFEKNAALGLAFSPDGRTLAFGTWQGIVKVLDVSTTNELAAPAPHHDWVCSVAFSPDGKLLVSAGGSEFKPERNGGRTSAQVKLWDVTAGKELGEFIGHTNKVFSAIFSPDGRTLATGSADQTVRLWEVATRKQQAVLDGHTDAVWSVAFSADGKTVVSASADRTVRLWEAITGKELATLRGHEDEVRAVAFSPDGRTLATGSADWTACLWDLATREKRAVLKGHRGGVQSLTFSSEGTTLATGSSDETVKLWDVATGKERATLRGHRSGISAVAFSPDGQTLASAGLDDAVRLWTDTATNLDKRVLSPARTNRNSLSMKVKADLRQIDELMKGHTDRNAEKRILNTFKACTAAELNELIGGIPKHDFHELVSDMDDRLFGPDDRTAFLNLLSKERLEDLTIENRARLISTLQYHRTDARDEKAVRDVILGTKGADLSKLKKAIDHGGDHRNLHQLVFHDIDDSKIRGQLLEHFKKEGAAAPSGQVKVFSDIDDTFYVNVKDKRYPGETVYPGVRDFYSELDKGGAAREDADGDLMFLSARPYDRAGINEHLTRRMLEQAGVHDATILSGDILHLRSNELMAAKKFDNWMQVRQLYPEYGSVFIGDSGQGDAIFGARAAATPGTDMKKVFIHNVTDLNERQRQEFAAKGVHIFDTYIGAATEAYVRGLISKAGLLRVATAAKYELAKVPFTSPDQKAAREKDLARDLEAMRAALH